MYRCRGQMSLLGVVTFSALYPFEIFRRRFAKLILKAFAEVSHGAHAHHESDFLDGEFAFEQQMFGISHLELAYILVGRQSSERLHLAVKRAGTYVHTFSQIVDVNLVAADALLYVPVYAVKEIPVSLVHGVAQHLPFLVHVLRAAVGCRCLVCLCEQFALAQQVSHTARYERTYKRLGYERVGPDS